MPNLESERAFQEQSLLAPVMFAPAPYEKRHISFKGVESWQGYSLKAYLIHKFGDEPDAPDLVIQAMTQASPTFPQPAANNVRPGVGFLILHQGAADYYLVLCHWDNENELVTRVFVKSRDDGEAGWREGGARNSFCVWDLEILWHERNTYIKCILSKNPDIGSYIKSPFLSGNSCAPA